MSDVKSLWRNQKTEQTVTLENIHQTAEKFQRRIRRALWIEYGASAFVIAVFGFYIWALPGSMVKVGSALCIVGVLGIVWNLRKRMAVRRVPDLSGPGLVEFHRQALLRQRDAVNSAWLWYILPAIPGMVLMMLGRWYQLHAPGRSLAWDHEVIALCAVVILLALGIIRLLQVLRVAKLQRKIDELEKLR
jgi:low affinity Fe/Cu permease